MDAERKMVCQMADNVVGGVSSGLFTVNGIHHPEERTGINWALAPGQRFKPGAIYGIAIWWISDGPAPPDPQNA